MQKSPKPIKITWEQFEKDIKALADKIPIRKFTKILAISRGGLIPAYFLARYLAIKYVRTLCVASYTDKNEQEQLKVFPANLKTDIRNGWLIVDDLIDTGKTLELAKKYYPNSKIAVLYYKKHSPDMANYNVKRKNGWVVLPWEQ